MTAYVPARQRSVGQRLRGYRESAGCTLADAARILDCHPAKVSRAENGIYGIRARELRELLAGYDAGPRWQRPWRR